MAPHTDLDSNHFMKCISVDGPHGPTRAAMDGLAFRRRRIVDVLTKRHIYKQDLMLTRRGIGAGLENLGWSALPQVVPWQKTGSWWRYIVAGNTI